jgi:excisionase family DNA binding protein
MERFEEPGESRLGPWGKYALTPKEISTLLRVKLDTVLAWIHRGELPAFNVAKRPSTRPRYRVRVSDFDAFLEKRAAKVAVPCPHHRRSYKGLS